MEMKARKEGEVRRGCGRHPVCLRTWNSWKRSAPKSICAPQFASLREFLFFVSCGGRPASAATGWLGRNTFVGRSEEHTSELQSHSDLVCRLLLEKKK